MLDNRYLQALLRVGRIKAKCTQCGRSVVHVHFKYTMYLQVYKHMQTAGMLQDTYQMNGVPCCSVPVPPTMSFKHLFNFCTSHQISEQSLTCACRILQSEQRR